MTPNWVKRDRYYLMEWVRLDTVVADWPAEEGWVTVESFRDKREIGEYLMTCGMWDGRPQTWPANFDVIAW